MTRIGYFSLIYFIIKIASIISIRDSIKRYTFNFTSKSHTMQSDGPVTRTVASWEKRGWLKRRERAKEERQGSTGPKSLPATPPVRFHFFCRASRDCEDRENHHHSRVKLRRTFRLSHCPASSSYYLRIYFGILISRTLLHIEDLRIRFAESRTSKCHPSFRFPGAQFLQPFLPLSYPEIFTRI